MEEKEMKSKWERVYGVWWMCMWMWMWVLDGVMVCVGGDGVVDGLLCVYEYTVCWRVGGKVWQVSSGSNHLKADPCIILCRTNL